MGSLRVTVRRHGVVLDRELWSPIIVGDSSWELDTHRGKRVCVITVVRRDPKANFPELFKPDRPSQPATTASTTITTTSATKSTTTTMADTMPDKPSDVEQSPLQAA